MSNDKKNQGFEEPPTAYAVGPAESTGASDAPVTVTVSPHHATWARGRVAAGAFKTPEEAITWALDYFLPVTAEEDEDDDWVLPYIEEAQRDLDAGRFVSGEEVQAELRARIERLRSKPS